MTSLPSAARRRSDRRAATGYEADRAPSAHRTPKLSVPPGTLPTMVERTFVYTDGSSHKFWSISVDGARYTVHFGRVGTRGQVKTKDVADDDAARVAAGRLIAEKISKGYVEQANGANPPVPPTVTDGARTGPSATTRPRAARRTTPAPPEHLTSVTAPHPGTMPPTETPLTKVRPPTPTAPAVPARSDPAPLAARLDLTPLERAQASWRPIADPPGPAAPFDPHRAEAALSCADPSAGHGWWWHWSAAPFTGPLSREEAAAWLWATNRPDHTRSLLGDARARLRDPDAHALVQDGDPYVLAGTSLLPRGLALECLLGLLPAATVADWLLSEPPDRSSGLRRYEPDPRIRLAHGVRAFLLPRLSAPQRDGFTAAVRSRLATVSWPGDRHESPDIAFFLAAQLGLHDEVAAVVDRWPDGSYTEPGHDYRHQPQSVVFGLGDPAAVLHQISRLGLRLRSPEQVAAFLAHTGTAELDLVAAHIAPVDNRDEAAALNAVLAKVHDVAAVAPMLELLRTSRAPGVARVWLAAHPRETLVGAARLLSRTGRVRDQAEELLRTRARAGDDLAAAAAQLDPADAARLAAIAGQDSTGPRVSTAAELPATLRAALTDAAPTRSPALPDWLDPRTLPPLLLHRITADDDTDTEPDPATSTPGTGRAQLDADAVRTVLAACRALRPGESTPTVLATVRAHTDADAFAWAVFEAWRSEGAPTSGRWALLTLGALGGDPTAVRLAPLIRTWPGESQHQRAVVGLSVLAAIGTDTALMLLSGIAQKVKFKGLQARAREAMDEIAAGRGLSRPELDDRIVPDGGLDATGRRTFDFGPRRFTLAIGPDLKPVVRDEAGKVRSGLPVPGVKDDPEAAAAAVAEWKLLRKVVGDLIKVQSERLEQAMITQRRWSVAEFDRFLVHHPLQRHLVGRIVWAAWASEDQPPTTFRVTDELDLADADDQPIDLAPDVRIGVAHPLQLAAASRAAWGDLLADYGIVSPFAQLGRPVHDLTDAERSATDLTRFADQPVPATTLVRVLEQRGWERGMPLDAGIFALHTKSFPTSGLTVIIEYPGVPVGYIVGWEDQHIEHCTVLRRTLRTAHELGWGAAESEKRVPWGQVDPIVCSEVLADLHAVLEKAR